MTRVFRSVAWLLLLGFAFYGPRAAAAKSPDTGRFLYLIEHDAVVDVYDIAANHALVTTFPTVRNVGDVKGVCASPGSHLLYLSYLDTKGLGWIAAVDLVSHHLVWNDVYAQGVDRLSCNPDGTRLFVPSGEYLPKTNVLMVDGLTGKLMKNLPAATLSHDSLSNLKGDRVYLETKSTQNIYLFDEASGTPLKSIGPLAGIPGPFTFTADETRLYANVYGLNGFEIYDLVAGKSLERVALPNEPQGEGNPVTFEDNHGIALTPDEKEIWIADGPRSGGSKVHIFDVSNSPARQIAIVDTHESCPHWITFSLKGDYAYIAARSPILTLQTGVCTSPHDFRTTVVNTATREIVGKLANSVGYYVEVDLKGGVVTAVGSQYGVGRVASKTP